MGQFIAQMLGEFLDTLQFVGQVLGELPVSYPGEIGTYPGRELSQLISFLLELSGVSTGCPD